MDFRIPLKVELTAKLPWLDELGFRIVRHDYSWRSFGDSLVVLQSNSLRLRFVRERGYVDAQVASLAEPDFWPEVSFVLEAIGRTSRRTRDEPELEAAAEEVRENLGALIQAMGPDLPQTKLELERRQRERLREAMQPKPRSNRWW